VTRKTVSFSMPAKAASSREPAGAGTKRHAPDVVIEAHADDWVSDRHARAEDGPTKALGPGLVIDLVAERGLMEVFALSMLAPFTLGFFWLVNAMAGRVRF
jgi:hypothetical protein